MSISKAPLQAISRAFSYI